MRVDDSLSIRPREVGKPGNGRPAREEGRVEEEEEEGKPEADSPCSVCGIIVLAVLKGVGLLRGLVDVGIVALWVWVSPPPRSIAPLELKRCRRRCHPGLPPPLPPPCGRGLCAARVRGAWGKTPVLS